MKGHHTCNHNKHKKNRKGINMLWVVAGSVKIAEDLMLCGKDKGLAMKFIWVGVWVESFFYFCKHSMHN